MLKYEPIYKGKFTSQIELENRNAKARAYSRKCAKKSNKHETLMGIVACSLISVLFTGMIFVWLCEPQGYYASDPTDYNNDGLYYEWVEE